MVAPSLTSLSTQAGKISRREAEVMYRKCAKNVKHHVDNLTFLTAEERKLVLQALVMQAHRPGFKAAAGPVIAVWRRLLAATGLACAPCEPAQRSSSDPV